jgi:hypothetical protein
MARVYHEDMEFRAHHNLKDVELASMSMEGSLEV